MSTPTFPGAGDGWITDPADPRLVALWPGATDYTADDLGFPLWCARLQCERFAPELVAGDPVPENYVAAQVLQARALVRAGYVGDGDRTGLDEQGVVVYPMDWTVKALLRPKRGRPYFGGGQA